MPRSPHDMLGARRHDQRGFTLIELLVVILIIGILAAIAIPAFIAQRVKAQDADAKSFARHAQTAMETHFHDGQTYVGATPAALRLIEPALNTLLKGPTLTTTTLLTATGYRVTVTSKSTNTWVITRAATGAITRSCTRPNTKGSCRTTLLW